MTGRQSSATVALEESPRVSGATHRANANSALVAPVRVLLLVLGRSRCCRGGQRRSDPTLASALSDGASKRRPGFSDRLSFGRDVAPSASPGVGRRTVAGRHSRPPQGADRPDRTDILWFAWKRLWFSWRACLGPAESGPQSSVARPALERRAGGRRMSNDRVSETTRLDGAVERPRPAGVPPAVSVEPKLEPPLCPDRPAVGALDCFDRTPASDHGRRHGADSLPPRPRFRPGRLSRRPRWPSREGLGSRRRSGACASGPGSRRMVQASNGYGAEVTARVLVPLFSLLCLALTSTRG